VGEGVIVGINAEALHFDGDIFEDPEKFSLRGGWLIIWRGWH
jgi:hypothetical protein